MQTHMAAPRAGRTTRGVLAAAAAIVLAGFVNLGPVLAITYAQEAMQQEGEQEQQPKASEPLPYAQLKSWLPETLGNLKRIEARGEKVSLGEMKYTTAEGDYGIEGDNENEEAPPSAMIVVMDWSATPTTAQAASFWASSEIEIDNESDTQYSKTLKIEGMPAYVDYNKEYQSGEINVLVGKATIVRLAVENVPDEQFQAMYQQLNLKKLAEMYGAQPATQEAGGAEASE